MLISPPFQADTPFAAYDIRAPFSLLLPTHCLRHADAAAPLLSYFAGSILPRCYAAAAAAITPPLAILICR
jgi:hypothetical protein